MRIAAIDPSLTNFGMAKLEYDGRVAASMIGDKGAPAAFTVINMKLICTEKSDEKKVRRNSDDLSRSRAIIAGFHDFIADCDLVFAEVPSGAQNARAAFAFGIVVGILAGCPVPIIQVQPLETKKASVGVKTASKAQMMTWAFEAYPDAPWIRKGARFTLANEHLADAVAIAHAGIKTDQFAQLQALMKKAA